VKILLEEFPERFQIGSATWKSINARTKKILRYKPMGGDFQWPLRKKQQRKKLPPRNQLVRRSNFFT
jgi:hypothetical protein